MEICRFISDVPNYFTCGICSHISLSPIEHVACDTIFCQSCIRHELEAGGSDGCCPHCQGLIDLSSSIDVFDNTAASLVAAASTQGTTEEGSTPQAAAGTPLRRLNRHLKAMYDELLIRCEHYPRCDTIFPMSELSRHEQEDCDYMIVSCNYTECEYHGERRVLSQHCANCPFRPVFCQYCDEEIAFCHLQEKHYNQDCPSYPMYCSRCQLPLQRKEIEVHEREVCPLTIVCCSIPGCHVQCIRDQLPDHLEEEAVKHMNLLLRIVEEQRQEIERLVKEKEKEKEKERTQEQGDAASATIAAPVVAAPVVAPPIVSVAASIQPRSVNATPRQSFTAATSTASTTGGSGSKVSMLPMSRVVSFDRKSIASTSRSNSTESLVHMTSQSCRDSPHHLATSMHSLVAPVLIGESNMSINQQVKPLSSSSHNKDTSSSGMTPPTPASTSIATTMTPSVAGTGAAAVGAASSSSPSGTTTIFTLNNRKYVLREIDGLLFDEEYQCHLKACSSCFYTRPDNLLQRFYSGFRADEETLPLIANKDNWLCSKCAPITRTYSFGSSERLNAMN